MRTSTDRTLTGAVRQKLRNKILGGELRPGQRLLENDLCAELEIGRTPLREAMIYLEGEGMLLRNHGWEVASEQPDRLPGIFEGRAAIEGAIARLAAGRMTDTAAAELEALCQAMEPGPRLPRRDLNDLNGRFHALIETTAGNPFLVEFRQRTAFQYWLLQIPVMFSDDEVRAANDQHRAILAALIARDAASAEALARAHVEATQRIVTTALAAGGGDGAPMF